MDSPCRFRNTVFAAASLATAVLCFGAAGETFDEALAGAYLTNPDLRAARAALHQVDERVPEALAGWRPQVDVVAGGGYVYTEDEGGEQSSFSASNGPTAVLRLRVRQPLYDFSTTSAVEQADFAVKAERAQLLSVEQDTLLRAARAYLDMIRATALESFSREFSASMDAASSSAERQLKEGLVNIGAVAEARSQKQVARSRVIDAEASLAVAREEYQKVIGRSPQNLTMPALPTGLPGAQDDAVVRSDNYPPLLAAIYAERAAKEGVDVSKGRKLPTVYLEGQADVRSAAVLGLISVPLYDGLSDPRIRAAKQEAIKAQYDVEARRREARVVAVSAWQAFQRAKAQIAASSARIDAAVAAAAAVKREQSLGLKTPADLYRNELSVLDAKTNQIGAQRDLRIAALELLAAMGQLTARNLGLPVSHFDETGYHNKVRTRWFGTGTGPK
jgi:TolC family type I secretion outer membrane protein